MAVIRQYHKDTDTTYVYESTSYWDPEKKQSRSKRKCIGKVDPATGEIVPTGRRGRKKAAPSGETDRQPSLLEEARAEAAAWKAKAAGLEERAAALERENRDILARMEKIRALSSSPETGTQGA